MKLVKILGVVCILVLITGIASAAESKTPNKVVREFQGIVGDKTMSEGQYVLFFYIPEENKKCDALATEEQFNNAVVGEMYNYKSIEWNKNGKEKIELNPV